jgi:hypothetical protein
MTALPFTGDTIFRWQIGREEVAAQAIGAIAVAGRSRVVLLDTAERHWLAAVTDEGRLTEIIAGPVTGAQALHAAELVVAGIKDHGSATGLVNLLALGLVARVCAEGRPA